MNRQPIDPMLRLARVENAVAHLQNENSILKNEITGLKARLRTLEIECGLAGESQDDIEDVDA